MSKNTEFIYQIDKKEQEKNIELIIYSTNEKNQINTKKINIPYTIIVLKKDFEELHIQSDNIILANDKLKNKNGEKVLKLEVKSKELNDFLLKKLKESESKVYEADLPPEHQWLIDKEIPIISNTKNKDKEYLPLRYASIDIESIGKDLNNQEIILISSYSPDGLSKVYVNCEKLTAEKLKKVKREDFEGFKPIFNQNEKELLEEFKKDLIELEPEVIFGWNVIDFDFKVIRDRMRKHAIEFKFSKYEGECKLRIINDFFRDSSFVCPGVLVFDVIQLLRTNYISFEDYKLDTVAKEVLGDNKIDIMEEENEDFEDKISAIENLFASNPGKLVNYNFKDSLLVSQIVEKLKLMELMCRRSIITETPLLKVKSPIATLDIMYLKELHKRGLVAPSNFTFDQSSPIEGAFVLEPKRNFYENVFVFDFKSLYPSIIMTFNIDPFTIDEKGEITAPNDAKFVKDAGILPELILRLYKERDKAKKEKDKIKSNAIKITMNSFYGAMASPKSRFHNRDVGGAITAFGREILQKAKEFAEKKGYNVVYGDTDSVFVEIKGLEGKSLENKKSAGFELEKAFNEYFNNWIAKEFGMKNFLTIEMEKIFSKFFIASKKRYVGYDEISDKLMFTGMEAIRGDWTELAQRFQVNLVNQIFVGKKKEEIEKFMQDYAEKLKKGEFDEQLVYKKKITKPLDQYTKTTPPHVRAAREVRNFSGRLVKYVMTDKGPKHISLLGELINYDYEHYINKQLKGVSDDLLDTFGIDFDEVLNKKKQKSLDKFF